MGKVCPHCRRYVERAARHFLRCSAIAFQFGPEESAAERKVCALCRDEFSPGQEASHSGYCDACRWTDEARRRKREARRENESRRTWHVRRSLAQR